MSGGQDCRLLHPTRSEAADTSWMTVAAIISTVTRKITAKNFISTNKQRRNDGLITCLQTKYCYIPGGPEKAVPRF